MYDKVDSCIYVWQDGWLFLLLMVLIALLINLWVSLFCQGSCRWKCRVSWTCEGADSLWWWWQNWCIEQESYSWWSVKGLINHDIVNLHPIYQYQIDLLEAYYSNWGKMSGWAMPNDSWLMTVVCCSDWKPWCQMSFYTLSHKRAHLLCCYWPTKCRVHR